MAGAGEEEEGAGEAGEEPDDDVVLLSFTWKRSADAVSTPQPT
jgi:hypothetical protein